jgi:hypothetical protein
VLNVKTLSQKAIEWFGTRANLKPTVSTVASTSKEKMEMPNVPQPLLDKLAGLIVEIQREAIWWEKNFSPESTANRKFSAWKVEGEKLLLEINKYSDDNVTCHLCQPPKPLNKTQVKNHDIEFHGRVFRS